MVYGLVKKFQKSVIKDDPFLILDIKLPCF